MVLHLLPSMKKLILLVLTVLSTSVALADEHSIYVEGTDGIYCRRNIALYDRITDKDIRLVAKKFMDSADFLYRPGFPKAIAVLGSDKGIGPSGSGVVEVEYISRYGEVVYRMYSRSTQYAVSEYACIKK